VRKRVIVIMGGIVLLVAVVGASVWLLMSPPNKHTTKVAATPVATKQTVVLLDKKYLQDRVNNPDLQVEAKALPEALRPYFTQQHQTLLPPGVTMSIDSSTFRQDQQDNRAAAVDATLSNGQVFALRLVLEDGHWLMMYAKAK